MSIFDEYDYYARSASKRSGECDKKSESTEVQLFHAASRGKLEIVVHLLSIDTPSQLEVKTLINGLNAAHIASKKGYAAILGRLLDYDSSLLCSQTSDGRSCEMIAAAEGHLNILQLLRAYEKDSRESLRLADESGNTAVHYAAWNGHLSCVRFLVEECGRDCHAVNLDRVPPVQIAAAANFIEIVSYLLSRGTASSEEKAKARDEEPRSCSGMNTFLRACSYGSVETVELLLHRNFSEVESRSGNGNGGLHCACQHGHYAVVRFILQAVGSSAMDSDERRGYVNSANQYGLTALHYACVGGYYDLVDLLLQQPEIKVNVLSATGETPFELAAVNGKHEISRILYEREKVNIFRKDSLTGKSVVEKVVENGFKELANTMMLWSFYDLKLSADDL